LEGLFTVRLFNAPFEAGFDPIVAHTHSVFATACEMNAPDIASTRRSSCPIIRSPSFVPVVENTYSVFSTTFELNLPDITSARRFSCPIIRSPGFVPVVGNTHSVLAASCELNSPVTSYRLRPPLQLSHQPLHRLCPHRRIRPQRV
jgi:hypothetical protein